MGFEPSQWKSHLESVNKLKEHMEDALEEAKAALAKSGDNMAKYYDQRWTLAPDYKPGDKVYLDASDIQTNRPLRKLFHCRLGPFPIVKKVSNGVYQLQLPPSMSRLHLVFNIVKLTPAPVDPIKGDHRWRRRMGCRRSIGQQNDEPETMLPGQVGGIWSGT